MGVELIRENCGPGEPENAGVERKMRRNRDEPPTTPPTIAPVFVEEWLVLVVL
jgi:hypothetical protein